MLQYTDEKFVLSIEHLNFHRLAPEINLFGSLRYRSSENGYEVFIDSAQLDNGNIPTWFATILEHAQENCINLKFIIFDDRVSPMSNFAIYNNKRG